MSTVTDFVRADKEYGQLLSAIVSAKNARSPLPTLVAGLCDGATDAVYASLLNDLKNEDKRTALLIFPDEKECVRMQTSKPPIIVIITKKLSSNFLLITFLFFRIFISFTSWFEDMIIWNFQVF